MTATKAAPPTTPTTPTTPPAAPPRAAAGQRFTSRMTGGSPLAIGLAAAAMGTTWMAMWSWRGFTTQSALFLGPLFLLALLVGGLGVALRLARVPIPIVVFLQTLGGLLAAQALITGYGLPSPTALADLRERLSAGLDSAQAYAAPVPSSAAGVEPLLILGGLACLVLVDLLACSLRRVSLAGLPLLVIYTIPVSMTGVGVSWWVFAVVAGGFALMLFLQESDQLSRWGRTLGQDAASSDPSAFGVRTGDVRSSAAGIAALATAAALVLPMLIPTLSLSLFSGGFGNGSGDDLRIENPMTDLRRDLNRGADIPLLNVTTADPDPDYLRIAVLTRLGDDSWSAGDRQVPDENLVSGPLPPLTGVSDALLERSGPGFGYQVDVLDSLESLWLPTAQNLTEIFPQGDWRFDTDTMDFLSGQEDVTTAGHSYSFEKIDLDLSADELTLASTSNSAVSPEFTFVPPEVPARVQEIARAVTEGYGNRYQRAVALQNWFREDGGFQYSLATDGSGTDDLVSFLEEGEDGRTGYCEQFASAMAIMARTLGIPARVAVGFLSGEEIGAQRWQFSAHDMHAWPELFFQGSGWVRFEPTPSAGPASDVRATRVPPYTDVDLEVLPVPSAEPSGNQATEELPNRGADPATGDASGDDTATDGTSGILSPWMWRLGGGLLAAIALVGLAYVPQLLRRARRERRWRTGGAQAAWEELRDTAVDLGVIWRPGLSPRAMRTRLVEHFGAPPDSATPERPPRGPAANPRAVDALDRIVHEVELLRYARTPGSPDPQGLRFDTELCGSALAGGATRAARRRAQWWPRSLFSRQVQQRSGPATDEPTMTQGVLVDHVG